MQRVKLCIILLVICIRVQSQSDDISLAGKSHIWWVLYLSGAVHPPDVTIGTGNMGWGGGQTILFPIGKRTAVKRIPFWFGIDFNQHYFGTTKVLPYKVHYENWQFTFVGRFTNTTNSRIKPFIDLQVGARYLASFTTENRDYSGVIILRTEDFISSLNQGSYTNSRTDDYNIRKEYGRVMWVCALSSGLLIPWDIKHFGGVTLRGNLIYGSIPRFADREQIKTVNDVYDYPLKEGSRFLFTFQLGITL